MIRTTLLLSLATLLATPVSSTKASSLNWFSAAELYCSHIPRDRTGSVQHRYRPPRKYRKR